MLRIAKRLLSGIWLPAVLLAQGAGVGTITGIVTDSSDAAIAGAGVEAENIATGIRTMARTNQSGNYVLPNLLPGEYILRGDVSGFKRYVRSGLTVRVGEVSRVDLPMEVGAVTESLNVTAAAPAVETETGALGRVITNRQITQLPLNGRNVYDLMTLVPGASRDNTGRVRVNGSRARSNEFLVDGVTQVSPETRADPIAPPPVDSIEEFNILTSSYSAEYGNSSGGLVNAATRSGGNGLHGTLWEFLRNDKLNTRNFFAAPGSSKPVLRQNQFGAAGGGPVWLPHLYNGRNHTFFFADYEGQRVRSQSVFNVTVPTAAWRSGDFSSLLGPELGVDALGRPVRQGQIYDPSSQRAVNGQAVRDPFPGNAIPQNRFDPASVKSLALWPQATGPQLTQNFRTATSTGNDADRFDVRIDHNITGSNRVFGRYSHRRIDSLATVPFRGATGDFDSSGTTDVTWTGAWTSTLSASKVNDLRLAYFKSDNLRVPYLADTNGAALLGVGRISTMSGLPNLDISDIQGVGSNFSGGYNGGPKKVLSFIDHFSIIHGRQTIKFGGEVRNYRTKNLQPAALNGRFLFRATQTSLPGSQQSRTGNAFASFLLGSVNETQYTSRDPGQEVNNFTGAGFIQDDFKITRRLTLNLGLRYELNTLLEDANGNHSTFDLASARVLAGKAKPDVPLDKNNFAPRFGFAYDISGSQTTVIRGGYGIFHQPIVGGGGNPLNGVVKFPFEFTSNAVSPNGIDPVTTLSAGPVILPEFDPTDPRLGFGTNVQLQTPNLAPYVQQWNLTIERTLWGSTVLRTGYVGSAGKKLESGRNGYINLNQVPIEVARQAAKDQNTINPDTSALRPYPNFNEVQPLLPRYGDSNYHSLQVSAEQRMSGGLTFLASYTWSKSIDNNAEIFNFTGGSWPQDVYNLRAERAVSTADVPHQFTGSWVWDLPFGAGRRWKMHGLLNSVAGGWQLGGIATLASGRPVDVEQSTNTTRTFSLMQRPNISGNPVLSSDERTLDRFFNTSVFSAADPLSFGTSPRNPIRGPGLVNFDLAINKQWKLFESAMVEFRGEMFNFTNTPPFQLNTRTTYNPNLPLDRQSFGKITSAGNGRVVQLALKFRF